MPLLEQRDRCRKYAELNNMIIVKEFAELVSAYSARKPELEKIIPFVQKHNITGFFLILNTKIMGIGDPDRNANCRHSMKVAGLVVCLVEVGRIIQNPSDCLVTAIEDILADDHQREKLSLTDGVLVDNMKKKLLTI